MTYTLNRPARPAREHFDCATRSRMFIATFCAVIFVFAAGDAFADVTGSVCVENGAVISVNGKRSSGRCIDGTLVRLYGVLAPTLDHECRISGGSEPWRCGLASAAVLLQAVKGRKVEFRGNSNDREGRLMAICFVAGRSLNQFMVEMGWAASDRSTTSMLNEFEVLARETRRGLWTSDFEPEVDD
jgi:endonuclease YncB( thermonuclease family)